MYSTPVTRVSRLLSFSFAFPMVSILGEGAEEGLQRNTTVQFRLQKEAKNLTLFQGGSGGKWQTPHQKAKVGTHSRGHGKIEPGDIGIWATCAKGQEGRATEELKLMFEEVSRRLHLPC